MDTLGWVSTAFKQSESELNGNSKPRREAFQRFTEMGFPSSHDEAWHYTNMSFLANRPLTRARNVAASTPAEAIEPFGAVVPNASRFVFVNGAFAEHLSSGAIPGIEVTTLRRAASQPKAPSKFGSIADGESRSLVAFNASFAEDGLLVTVAPNVELDTPIHVLFLTSPEEGEVFVCPRVLVTAGENSRCVVVEHHAALRDESYFSCGVTEVAVGAGAYVEHVKIQDESSSAIHFSTVDVVQERSSRFTSQVFHLGGQTVRHEVNPTLNGEGCETYLNGLSILRGNQHVDNATIIDHASPHCFSREIYKGILADESKGAFSGTIIVRPGAQKTNAIQANNALLLSNTAEMNSKPQLKIWADDVKCTHGATVGQLDENALFYLRSRGLPEGVARQLLIQAFAGDIVDGCEVIRPFIEERVVTTLSELL